MAVRFFLLVLTLAAFRMPDHAPTASDVPEWAVREMAGMIGVWTASNAAYTSEDEPYVTYGMNWTWDPGKSSASGILFGSEPEKEPITFWAFRLFWHPGDQQLLLAQHGRDGTYGVGPVRRTGDASSEILQEFHRPDGSSFWIGHRTTTQAGERHDATFEVDESGAWQPQRTYVWLHRDVPPTSDGLTDSAPSSSTRLRVLATEWKRLYDGGLTYAEFLDSAVARREMWLANTDRARVPNALRRRAESMGGTWRLLAVAEDACSDSANILPYLQRLVAEVEGLEMRVVNSKVGRDVMEAHPTSDGRAATPTILLLRDDFIKAGCLIERPAAMQAWALEAKDTLPSSEYMKQKFARYDEDAGITSMTAIVEAIEAAARGEMMCQ